MTDENTPLEAEPVKETYGEQLIATLDALPTHLELGWRKEAPDDRDWIAPDKLEHSVEQTVVFEQTVEHVLEAPVSAPNKKTPKRFSRRERTGPVLDQALTPRCVAYSGASIKTEHERKEHKRTYVADPDEYYARLKERDGIPNEDGTFIRTGCQFGAERGMLMHDPKAKDKAAKPYPIEAYVRLTSLEQIVDHIHNRGCVWFGITVDKTIFTPIKTNHGHVLAPPNGNPVGGHAMVAVGYDLTRGWLEIKNSWGEEWGDEGHAFMPMTHFTTYVDWDAWAVVDRKDLKKA